MKKFLITFVLTLVLLFGAYSYRETLIDVLPIDQSGWSHTEQGYRYLDEKGEPLSGWADLEGKRYYFQPATGIMHTGWLEEGGKRWYLEQSGVLASQGWVQDGEQKCYVGSSGHTLFGWLEEGGKRYYLNSQGAPLTGWQDLEEKRYYFTETGAAASGWLELDESRYYLSPDGSICTGWVEIDQVRHYLNDQGAAVSGWVDTPEGRFHLNNRGTPSTGMVLTDLGLYCFQEDGSPYTGWTQVDGLRRYFGTDGKVQSGWFEEDGNRYYLTEDGVPAVGKLVIEDQTYFFTSTGVNFIMVNPWNPLPEGFEVELVQASGAWLDPVCQEALEQMLSDCRAAGHYPQIVSSYRSIADQRVNLNNMIASWQNDGYSYADAYAHAIQIVAVPGTSEHHLGLAFDIVDSGYPKLNHQQANMPTQKWLMENCWKYGFIMRYPEGTTEITGIIYEPWHYRYVGRELAQEITELGITLEEYIDQLTNDGTTVGGKQTASE